MNKTKKLLLINNYQNKFIFHDRKDLGEIIHSKQNQETSKALRTVIDNGSAF